MNILKKVTLPLLATALFAYAGGTGTTVTADEAISNMKEGNARFVNGTATHLRQDSARRVETTLNGQHPFATVITCSDSRTPAELIFDQGIGDLFIIRVAGNVIDTDEAGSIEYGVDHLHTPVLVVLGHSYCGAVAAVADSAKVDGNIPELVDNIIPAITTVRAEQPELTGYDFYKACEIENIWQSIEDLHRTSPTSVELINENKLTVVGAYYDIKTGEVEWLGEHPEAAALLEQHHHEKWDVEQAYGKGSKVNYKGKAYEAQWWTQGETPSSKHGAWKKL